LTWSVILVRIEEHSPYDDDDDDDEDDERSPHG
jgi:hypothetical protein